MASRFWLQAQRDLQVARIVCQPSAYFAAARHAYEAAEKALKAAHWHLRAEEPAWSHELDAVAERITARAEDVPNGVRAAFAVLTPMFAATRYPSDREDEPIPADLIGEGDAHDAIRSAEEVMAWVEVLLQQSPGRPRSTRRSSSDSPS